MDTDKKRVLIYAPFAMWSPHFETDLELAEIYLQKGYDVSVIHCNRDMGICEPNLDHSSTSCRYCTSRFWNGISWLGQDRLADVRSYYNITDEQKDSIQEILSGQLKTREDVENISFDSVDIGLSVMSSAISILREPEIDVVLHQDLIKKILQVALEVYFSFVNYIEKSPPDLVVMFNGRFAAFRPLLRIARKHGIDVEVHERGGVTGRYSLSRNTYPHDLGDMKQELARVNRETSLSDEERGGVARKWFEDRMRGKDQGWYSFTKHHSDGLLPAGYDYSRLNVVIFNNSEDEFVAIREWYSGNHEDQNTIIGKLVGTLSGRPDCMIYLRVHPNMARIDNSQIRGIAELKEQYPDLSVIPSDSKISTYALLRAADLVVVFGSTVGVEAAYLGKPCLLMGRAIYEDIPVCHQISEPGELESIVQTIRAGGVPIDPEEQLNSALQYGFYQAARGTDYKMVKQYSIRESVMIRDGVETNLRPGLLTRGIHKLRRYVRFS